MELRGVCFGQRIVTLAFRGCCESDTYSSLSLVLNGLPDCGHPCVTKDLVFPCEFAESPCLVYHPYGKKTVFINLSSLLIVTSMCSGTVVRPYIPGISPTENSCLLDFGKGGKTRNIRGKKMVGDPRSLPHGVSR